MGPASHHECRRRRNLQTGVVHPRAPILGWGWTPWSPGLAGDAEDREMRGYERQPAFALARVGEIVPTACSRAHVLTERADSFPEQSLPVFTDVTALAASFPL